MDTLDINQIAAVLRITPKTALNRLSTGLPMPPSFVVGRRRLFLRDQVEAWLRGQPGAVRSVDVMSTSMVGRRPGRPRNQGSLL
ncbi:MAG: helix-turn-helix domain-containing protein [Steroidobacteraceae bacterium]